MKKTKTRILGVKIARSPPSPKIAPDAPTAKEKGLPKTLYPIEPISPPKSPVKKAKKHHYNLTEKQKKATNYSDLIKNGRVTPQNRTMQSQGTNIQKVISVEYDENNAIYLKSGTKSAVGTNQEAALVTNNPPVAIPDVYTTPENTELTVGAPGHLDNDSDPDGDPVFWLSYIAPENGTVSGAATDGQFTYTPDPGFSGSIQ